MFRRLLKSPLFIVFLFFTFATAIVWTGVLDLLVAGGVVNKISMTASVAAWSIFGYIGARLVMLFRRNRPAFFALLIGLAVSLVIAEVGIRYLHPAGSRLEFRLWHSDAFHHITPQDQEMYHGYDGDAGEPIVVRTNNDGLRTHYARESFKEHEIRIAIVGDSFTFGLFNRQDAAYPHVLERMLRERFPERDIAVLNAGVVSWSPFIGQFVVDELLRAYAPTHILYMFDASDIGDDWEYARMASPEGQTPRFAKTIFSRSFRGGASWSDRSALLQRLYMPYTFTWAFMIHPLSMASSEKNPMIVHGLEIDGVRQRDRFFIYRYPPEKTRPFFEQTFEYVSAMADSANDMGAKFIFVVAPRYHHWNPDECPGNWESYAYSNHEPYQFAYLEFFDAQQQTADFPILNLLPAFKANADDGPYVFHFDAHWNANGHELVAKTLGKFLIEEGLLK